MFTIVWIIQRQVLRCVSFDVRYDSSSPGPTLSIPTSYSKSSPNYQTAPRTAHRRNPRTIGTLSGFCASACPEPIAKGEILRNALHEKGFELVWHATVQRGPNTLVGERLGCDFDFNEKSWLIWKEESGAFASCPIEKGV